MHEGLVDAELLPIAHGAPYDAAEHVAAALVGEARPIGQSEGEAAGVVGYDAVREQVLPLIRLVADVLGRLHYRGEEVGLEVGLGALHDAGQPLKPRAGVDVLRRQLLVVLAVDAVDGVVLGEDDAPDLDVAVVLDVVLEQLPAEVLRVVFLPAVVEDLGVRAAGALADLPVVGL